MLVQVLGTVQVLLRRPGTDVGVAEVVPVARPARRRLLSLLALHGGTPVPIDRIVEDFWRSDPPGRARATLHTHVSELRRALGPDLIRTEGDAYRLDLGRHELDTDAFGAGASAALSHARAGSWASAMETAATTLRLWRGDPFLELPDHPDAVVETARLVELRRTLRQVRAEALLGAGRTAEAVAELEQLVGEHPLHEELWEHLMSGRIQLGHHAAALQVYHRARAALTDLGLDTGPALRTLQTTALRRQEEHRRPPGGLPTPPTRFVGRGPALAELGDRLGSHRLVTVTGFGGVGKTRVALEVARRRADHFPGGTWFVPLAEVAADESVEHTLVRVLGLHGREDLAPALRRRFVGPALVVLDSGEHLLDAVRAVVPVLLECPGVHVLVTSREPLRVEGEVVHDLPPMAVPGPRAPVETLGDHDAVQLFLERAQIGPEDQDPGTMGLVAEVCRRLDGIPLALQLAAAEVRGLGVAGVLGRLTEDVGALGDDGGTAVPRHRTLAAVADWSFATLDEQERAVLRRLAVFRGGFTPEAAEAVAGGAGVPASAVRAVVGQLVEKSLVTRSGTVTVRYRLLEAVRQYAGHRLRTGAEHGAVADRHAQWYVDLARQMWRGVHDRSVRPGDTSPLLEMANLREARRHLEARGGRTRDMALLSAEIAHGATLAGSVREALEETRRAVEEAGDWPEWEVDMRNRLAHLFFLLEDGEESLAQSTRACELAQTLPPSGIAAWTFGHRADLGLHLGSTDGERALGLARDGVDVAAASGDPLAQIRCRGLLGHTLAWFGRGDEGLAELQAALDAARRRRDPLTEAELSGPLFQALLLTKERRRHGPATLAGDLDERFLSRRSPLGSYLPLHALVHAFLQSGRWGRAEEIVERLGDHAREGEAHIATVLARATTSWVRGRHDDAAAVLRQLSGEVVDPHWNDRYQPLRVEVAADVGDLDGARRVAEEYLSLDVGEARQSGKLGAVFALVRVEAMAAAAEPAATEEHADRARSAVTLGETLLARFPPLHGGSLAMETPATYLALARAELTRLTGADPHAWEVARTSADHVRFRLYAGLGRAEALLRVGDVVAARREADVVHARSERLGARGLQRDAARLLTTVGGSAPTP